MLILDVNFTWHPEPFASELFIYILKDSSAGNNKKMSFYLFTFSFPDALFSICKRIIICILVNKQFYNTKMWIYSA